MKKLKEIQESIPARLVLQNSSEQLSLAMNADGAEEKTLSRVDFPIVNDNNVGLMTPDMLQSLISAGEGTAGEAITIQEIEQNLNF